MSLGPLWAHAKTTPLALLAESWRGVCVRREHGLAILLGCASDETPDRKEAHRFFDTCQLKGVKRSRFVKTVKWDLISLFKTRDRSTRTRLLVPNVTHLVIRVVIRQFRDITGKGAFRSSAT